MATSALVFFSALIINFAIPRLMPGSPVAIFTGGVKLSAEARQAQITRFGLDGSIWEQFWRYITHALRGDFGVSFYYYPKPVSAAIAAALPWTLLVLLSSLVLQVAIGYFLGVTSAWKAGKRTDSVLQTISLVILSAPLFWVAMVLFYVFSFKLNWFPFAGAYTAGGVDGGVFARVADIARHAALPIISLTLAQYAAYQLILRNTMVGVLKKNYIITAEAKGLSQWRIKHRHAARNALLPVVTFLGLSLAVSVGGSVYIESVFSYPGIGKLIFDSVLSRDFPLLQGCFFVFSVVVILANIVIDIVYMYLDPRIRT
jgi:peptide/nickel transport system permease protein